MQGYFPTYTPRTPRLAEIYGKFDPAGSALSGAEKVSRIQLAGAAEERLKSQAEMEMYIKNTLLPWQLKESESKIADFKSASDLRAAQAEYSRSRAKALADNLTANQVYEQALDAVTDSGWNPFAPGGAPVPPPSSSSVGTEDYQDDTDSNNPIINIFGGEAEQESETAIDATIFEDLGDASGVNFNQKEPAMEGVTDGSWQNGNVVEYPLPKENPESDLVAVSGAEDPANLPPSQGKYRLPGPAGQSPSLSDPEEDSKNPLNAFINESIEAEFGTPENPKQSVSYGKMFDEFQAKNGMTTGYVSQSRIAPKDPIARAKAAIAIERLANDQQTINTVLSGVGMNFDTAQAFVQKFGGDSSVLDRAVEIRRQGAAEYGVPAGSNWDVVSQVIAKQNTAYFDKPEKTDPSAIAKTVSEINGALKGLQDTDGNIPDENLPAAEKLYAQRDAILGTPTGTSLFADRFQRLQDKSTKLSLAAGSGVSYGNIPPEQAPAELARLNEQMVGLAIERSPYFGSGDREKMGRWLSSPETRGLPFISDVSGVRTPLFPTEEQNVYRMWNPKDKVWAVYDLREKPQEAAVPAQAEQKTSKNANEAGIEFAQVARDAMGLSEEGRYLNPWERDTAVETDWLINAADYANTAVRNRVLAPAAEFAAGLSGRKLSLGRTSNPSLSDRLAAGRLTPTERRAILARAQNPLISFALESTLGK